LPDRPSSRPGRWRSWLDQDEDEDEDQDEDEDEDEMREENENQSREDEGPSGFVWLRADLCIRVAIHLDDEATLRATVGEIVGAVMTKPDKKPSIIYGVSISIFHCVIISIDRQTGAARHTPALQFLPEWFATYPTTPGITALNRLGYRMGFEFEIDEAGRVRVIPCTAITAPVPALKPPSLFSTIPNDVWDSIVEHLYSPGDLVNLASISPPCKAAAMRMLKLPHVDSYRLVSPSPPATVEPHRSLEFWKVSGNCRGRSQFL
jgi:hypothetical protein